VDAAQAHQRPALGPAAVLHAVAGHGVDDCLDATEAFERDIDGVEALVFTPRSQVGAELMPELHCKLGVPAGPDRARARPPAAAPDAEIGKPLVLSPPFCQEL
jgi:hypothetical protein